MAVVESIFCHGYFLVDIPHNSEYNIFGVLCLHMRMMIMKEYMTIKEASEKWGISRRQVQIHCQKKRIPGVVTVGTNYLIPSNASRPKYGYYSAPAEKEK